MGSIGGRLILATTLLLLGCGSSNDTETDDVPSGVDLAALDKNANPCVDFYRFACGGWQAAHPLSDGSARDRRLWEADKATGTATYEMLRAELNGVRTSEDPYAEQTAQYYTSCLQADSVPRSALTDELRRVYATNSISELMGVVARFRRWSSIGFMLFAVGADPEDSSRNVLWAVPRGWEMPERGDYLDDARQERRLLYLLHIRKMSSLFLPDDAPIDPAAVLRIETALVSASLPPEDTLDPRSRHHRMTFEEVEKLAPAVTFRQLLPGQNLPTGPVEVTEPEYVTALGTLFATATLQDLQHYVAWQFLQDEAPYLDSVVRSADFAFWGPGYSGRTQEPSAAQTCYQATMTEFGWALARPYVAAHFASQTIERVRDEVSAIRTALRARIEREDWLDPATRNEALAKLDAIIALVGYPDEWPQFPDVFIDPNSYLSNHWHLAEWYALNEVGQLQKLRVRGEWGSSPLVVNAYYQPTQNSIQLDAAILQPPVFLADAPRANRLGTLGIVIGHELTHGFDSIGRYYDASGNLRDIWSETTSATFAERSACLVDQYSRFQVLPGVTIDGELTLSENTADLGGVRVAYDALLPHEREVPKWHGFDAKQQFFLSFAQLYCENARPEAIEQQLATDRHSPNVARVNAVLSNLPEFAGAFSCQRGTPMVSPSPCEVW